MKLSLIAAVAENGVIGVDGDMPWHYSEDLQRFKATTMGHPVIMGRTTYDSIESRLGGPLPGRTNIVLSGRESLELPEGAVRASDTDEALELARQALDEGQETVYVVGGATVYEQFIDEADELVITEVPEAPEGDTFFPEIGDEWIETAREDGDEVTFVTYERA
jgi:dihydrofolate reductase